MHFCFSATAIIGYIPFILWKSRALPVYHPIWSLTFTSSTCTSIMLTKWPVVLFVNTSIFLTPMSDFSYPQPSHLGVEKRFYGYNFGFYQGSISRTEWWVSTSHYQLIPISCTLFRFLPLFCLQSTRYMPLQGIPSEIHTDCSCRFGEDVIQCFTHNLQSSIAFSVTGRHQSNGKAEHFGRTFQDYLHFYVGSNTSWYEVFTFSNVTINSTPSLWKQHIVPDWFRL